MGKILTHTILKTVKTHKIDAYFKKCHELKIIKELVERTTAPCFIDAVNAAISNAVAVNESK